MLQRAGLEPITVAKALEHGATAATPSQGHLPFTDEAKQSLESSLHETLALGHQGITGAHIVLGVLATDSDGGLARTLRSHGVGLTELEAAARELPVVRSGDGFATVLQTLVASPATSPRERRDIQIELVHRYLMEAQLREARELAERLLTEAAEEDLHRLLTAIGEMTGDVNLQADQAKCALDAGSDVALHGSLAYALAHQGDRAAAIDELAKATQTDDVDQLRLNLLEAAETSLALGDGQQAARYLDRASGDVAADWIRMWQAVVAAMVAHATGEGFLSLDDLEASCTEPPQAVRAIFHRARISVLVAAEELRTGSPRRAIKEAAAVIRRANDLGMEGVQLEAMEVRARALREHNNRKWRKAATEAAALAERLGRRVSAERMAAFAAE